MNWRLNICIISFVVLFITSMTTLFLGIYFSLNDYVTLLSES